MELVLPERSYLPVPGKKTNERITQGLGGLRQRRLDHRIPDASFYSSRDK